MARRLPPPDALPLLRDRIRPGVRVLFVGINPGIRSALTGHHFAGHANRFWRLLYDSRLVPEPLTFERDDDLPRWGFGLTNLVARPTRGMGDLRAEEYEAGRAALGRKVRRYEPNVVALVGVSLFRALFDAKGVSLGLQEREWAGARVFVLPNPSGRNARYSYAQMLDAFAALRRFTSHA
jgi:double-stranded uracil-DNA glycosylase